MSAITIFSNQETYNNLSTFKTVQEMIDSVNKHIEHNRHLLNKNAVRILRYLKDYSKKYKGVSYRTKNNIAKDLNLSKRTIIRNCNLLEQLNIINQHEMKRNSDFKQTSNAIVIQPFVGEDSENVTPMSHQKEDLLNNSLNKKKIINISNLEENEAKIIQYVANRFNDTIKKGINVQSLSAYVDRMYRHMEKEAIAAAKEAERAVKRQQEAKRMQAAMMIKGEQKTTYNPAWKRQFLN